MSEDRNFDRLTRAWLDLMPDEAPDRAIDAVLQTVATTPQVRRPWRRPTWRLSPMTRVPFAIGAAAIVVAAGAFYLVRSGPAEVGPPASPSPTATSSPPTPSPTPTPIPTELRARWMGEHRDVVRLNKGSTLLFGTTTFVMTESNQWDRPQLLESSASAVGDGRLRLESTTDRSGCEVGDVGLYGWSLSPSGRTLTITTESDGCADRSQAVPGTWWLAGCPNALCLGELDAGTYGSQYFAPRLDPGAAGEPDFGAITYTVPDGWANSGDGPQNFELVPANEMPPVAETDRRRNIGLFTQPTAMTQDRPCSDTVQPGVGRTVTELADWLRDVDGLVSTAPTPITIDGRAGQSLDLRRDPSWTKTCEGSTEPLVTFLNPGMAVGADQRVRLILLDLGDGDVVAIGVWTRDQATFDDFIPDALNVIESFRFE
jgi:hypothetical protein